MPRRAWPQPLYDRPASTVWNAYLRLAGGLPSSSRWAACSSSRAAPSLSSCATHCLCNLALYSLAMLSLGWVGA